MGKSWTNDWISRTCVKKKNLNCNVQGQATVSAQRSSTMDSNGGQKKTMVDLDLGQACA